MAVLVVAEFTDLYRVVAAPTPGTDDGPVIDTVSGGSNHGYAVLLLALAAVPMILGAARGARPAMAALAAIGLVVLFIALAVDLPDARESGAIRQQGLYENAQAEPATGFFLETLGAAMLLVAGGGLLILAGDRPADAGSGRRPAPPAEA